MRTCSSGWPAERCIGMSSISGFRASGRRALSGELERHDDDAAPRGTLRSCSPLRTSTHKSTSCPTPSVPRNVATEAVHFSLRIVRGGCAVVWERLLNPKLPRLLSPTRGVKKHFPHLHVVQAPDLYDPTYPQFFDFRDTNLNFSL